VQRNWLLAQTHQILGKKERERVRERERERERERRKSRSSTIEKEKKVGKHIKSPLVPKA